jgi:hypothetical protein
MSSNRLLSPTKLNVSDQGKIKYLVGDIKALLSYVDVLISDGPWTALNNSEKPIGSSKFIPTKTKCSNADTTVGESIDRYMYVNSVPTGSNKSLMAGLSYDIDTLENEAAGLIDVFTEKTDNKCKKIKAMCVESDGSLPGDKDIIKDSDGNGYLERAINVDEIKDIDPCMFYPENNKRVNPISGETCKEGFEAAVYPNDQYLGCPLPGWIISAGEPIIIFLCILLIFRSIRSSK